MRADVRVYVCNCDLYDVIARTRKASRSSAELPKGCSFSPDGVYRVGLGKGRPSVEKININVDPGQTASNVCSPERQCICKCPPAVRVQTAAVCNGVPMLKPRPALDLAQPEPSNAPRSSGCVCNGASDMLGKGGSCREWQIPANSNFLSTAFGVLRNDGGRWWMTPTALDTTWCYVDHATCPTAEYARWAAHYGSPPSAHYFSGCVPRTELFTDHDHGHDADVDAPPRTSSVENFAGTDNDDAAGNGTGDGDGDDVDDVDNDEKGEEEEGENELEKGGSNYLNHPCRCTGERDQNGEGWKCGRWGEDTALERPWCYVRKACYRSRTREGLVFNLVLGQVQLHIADCLVEEMVPRKNDQCPFAAMQNHPNTPVFDCRVGTDDRVAYRNGVRLSGGNPPTPGLDVNIEKPPKFLLGSIGRIVDEDVYLCQQVVPVETGDDVVSQNPFLRDPGTRWGANRVKRQRSRSRVRKQAGYSSFQSSAPDQLKPGSQLQPLLQAATQNNNNDSSSSTRKNRTNFREVPCFGFFVPPNNVCVDKCPQSRPFVDRMRRCRRNAEKQVPGGPLNPKIRAPATSLTPLLEFNFPWQATEAWVYIAPRIKKVGGSIFSWRFAGGSGSIDGKTHVAATKVEDQSFVTYSSLKLDPSTSALTLDALPEMTLCKAMCASRRPLRGLWWNGNVAHALVDGGTSFGGIVRPLRSLKDGYLGECTGIEFKVLHTPLTITTVSKLSFGAKAAVHFEVDRPLQPLTSVITLGLIQNVPFVAPPLPGDTLVDAKYVYIEARGGGCTAKEFEGVGLDGSIAVIEDMSGTASHCPLYLDRAAGGCNGRDDLSPVTSQDDCRAASLCLKFPTRSGIKVVNNPLEPAGCFFKPQADYSGIGRNSLVFNVHPDASAGHSTADEVSLCNMSPHPAQCDDVQRIANAYAAGATAVIFVASEPRHTHIGADGFPTAGDSSNSTEYNGKSTIPFGWAANAKQEWINLLYTGTPNKRAAVDPDPYAPQSECTAPFRRTLRMLSDSTDNFISFDFSLPNAKTVEECAERASNSTHCFQNCLKFHYNADRQLCGCAKIVRGGSYDTCSRGLKTVAGYALYEQGCAAPLPVYNIPPALGSELFAASQSFATGKRTKLTQASECATAYRAALENGGQCKAVREFERCMRMLCEDFSGQILARARDPDLVALWEFATDDSWRTTKRQSCEKNPCAFSGVALLSFLDAPGVTIAQRLLEEARAELTVRGSICEAGADVSKYDCPRVDIGRTFTKIRKRGILSDEEGLSFPASSPLNASGGSRSGSFGSRPGPAAKPWRTFAFGGNCLQHGCRVLNESECNAAGKDLHILHGNEEVQFRATRASSPLGCFWVEDDSDAVNAVQWFDPSDERCDKSELNGLFCSGGRGSGIKACGPGAQCICDCTNQLPTCERALLPSRPVLHYPTLRCGRFPFTVAELRSDEDGLISQGFGALLGLDISVRQVDNVLESDTPHSCSCTESDEDSTVHHYAGPKLSWECAQVICFAGKNGLYALKSCRWNGVEVASADSDFLPPYIQTITSDPAEMCPLPKPLPKLPCGGNGALPASPFSNATQDSQADSSGASPIMQPVISFASKTLHNKCTGVTSHDQSWAEDGVDGNSYTYSIERTEVPSANTSWYFSADVSTLRRNDDVGDGGAPVPDRSIPESESLLTAKLDPDRHYSELNPRPGVQLAGIVFPPRLHASEDGSFGRGTFQISEPLLPDTEYLWQVIYFDGTLKAKKQPPLAFDGDVSAVFKASDRTWFQPNPAIYSFSTPLSLPHVEPVLVNATFNNREGLEVSFVVKNPSRQHASGSTWTAHIFGIAADTSIESSDALECCTHGSKPFLACELCAESRVGCLACDPIESRNIFWENRINVTTNDVSGGIKKEPPHGMTASFSNSAGADSREHITIGGPWSGVRAVFSFGNVYSTPDTDATINYAIYKPVKNDGRRYHLYADGTIYIADRVATDHIVASIGLRNPTRALGMVVESDGEHSWQNKAFFQHWYLEMDVAVLFYASGSIRVWFRGEALDIADRSSVTWQNNTSGLVVEIDRPTSTLVSVRVNGVVLKNISLPTHLSPLALAAEVAIVHSAVSIASANWIDAPRCRPRRDTSNSTKPPQSTHSPKCTGRRGIPLGTLNSFNSIKPEDGETFAFTVDMATLRQRTIAPAFVAGVEIQEWLNSSTAKVSLADKPVNIRTADNAFTPAAASNDASPAARKPSPILALAKEARAESTLDLIGPVAISAEVVQIGAVPAISANWSVRNAGADFDDQAQLTDYMYLQLGKPSISTSPPLHRRDIDGSESRVLIGEFRHPRIARRLLHGQALTIENQVFAFPSNIDLDSSSLGWRLCVLTVVGAHRSHRTQGGFACTPTSLRLPANVDSQCQTRATLECECEPWSIKHPAWLVSTDPTNVCCDQPTEHAPVGRDWCYCMPNPKVNIVSAEKTRIEFKFTLEEEEASFQGNISIFGPGVLNATVTDAEFHVASRVIPVVQMHSESADSQQLKVSTENDTLVVLWNKVQFQSSDTYDASTTGVGLNHSLYIDGNFSFEVPTLQAAFVGTLEESDSAPKSISARGNLSSIEFVDGRPPAPRSRYLGIVSQQSLLVC